MQFVIKNINKSINYLMRTIGYKPTYFQKEGEFSIVRQIGENDYPRFHLYIKEKSFVASAPQAFGSESHQARRDKLNTFVFNLHLDQKKPSYEGAKGHSGEYDGEVVEGEAERIKNVLEVRSPARK